MTREPRPLRTLYGLFDSSGQCHYVGQTRNVSTRKRRHWRTHGDALTFRILSTACSCAESAEKERALIRRYRAKGAPLLNKSAGGISWFKYDDGRFPPAIVHVGTLKTFVSTAHVAYHFGTTTATTRNAFKRFLRRGNTAYLYVSGRNEVFGLFGPI